MASIDVALPIVLEAGLPVPLSLAVSTPGEPVEGTVRVVVADDPADEPDVCADYDVCLTSSPGAPRPWVCVEDLAGTLARMQATFRNGPLATVCAARLLRMHHASVEDGLFTESLALSTLLAGAEFRAWRAQGLRPQETTARNPRVAYRRTGDHVELVFGDGKANALSAALRDALHEALDTCLLDPTNPTVTITAEGPTFCAGGALDEFGLSTDLSLAHTIRLQRSIAALVHRLGARASVHLNGPAVGAGIEFAAAAQRLSGTRQSWLQLPELAMGLIPGAGGTVFIPRRIGRHRTMFLLLSACRLDASTAHQWGLLDELRD